MLSSAVGVGYLLKERVADVGAFVDAVRTVGGGGTVPDPGAVTSMLSHHDRSRALARLTAREREVLALMAEGRSNAAIAGKLVVTPKAVDKHINPILTPGPTRRRRQRADAAARPPACVSR